MANIFQIEKAILDCIDTETGEILDFEALESLQMDREKKIEGVAVWKKDLDAQATAIKAEIDVLSERKRILENHSANLKEYLSKVLNGASFETARAKITWRSSRSVEITDESQVPKEYMVEKIAYSPDKKAIKEALDSGSKVGGAIIVEKNNIQIK